MLEVQGAEGFILIHMYIVHLHFMGAECRFGKGSCVLTLRDSATYACTSRNDNPKTQDIILRPGGIVLFHDKPLSAPKSLSSSKRLDRKQ